MGGGGGGGRGRGRGDVLYVTSSTINCNCLRPDTMVARIWQEILDITEHCGECMSERKEHNLFPIPTISTVLSLYKLTTSVIQNVKFVFTRLRRCYYRTWHLTHWGRDKIVNILQPIFSNLFCWMKIFLIWLKFHWNMFTMVQITTSQRWFRKWPNVEQATSHYLYQWWSGSVMQYIGFNELTVKGVIDYMKALSCARIVLLSVVRTIYEKWK